MNKQLKAGTYEVKKDEIEEAYCEAVIKAQEAEEAGDLEAFKKYEKIQCDLAKFVD
jgi:hypothetical protein